MIWARRIRRLVWFASSLVYQTAKLALLARRLRERERPRFRAEQQRRACRHFCRILGMRVTQVGEDPRGSFLVVSNHLGLGDPWVLASVLPVAFAAKKEMASWPVMGWVCRMVGIIFVERENRRAAPRFVEEVQAAMRAGVRVLVFPEGTTSNGHALRAFKTSGFEAVAGMADGAVLPVYFNAVRIDGKPTTPETREQICWLESESFVEAAWIALGLKSVNIEVRIGSPIPTGKRDRKELARLSQNAVQVLGGELIA